MRVIERTLAVFVSATLRLDEAEQLAHLRHTKEAIQLVQGGVVAPRDEMDVKVPACG